MLWSGLLALYQTGRHCCWICRSNPSFSKSLAHIPVYGFLHQAANCPCGCKNLQTVRSSLLNRQGKTKFWLTARQTSLDVGDRSVYISWTGDAVHQSGATAARAGRCGRCCQRNGFLVGGQQLGRCCSGRNVVLADEKRGFDSMQGDLATGPLPATAPSSLRRAKLSSFIHPDDGNSCTTRRADRNSSDKSTLTSTHLMPAMR